MEAASLPGEREGRLPRACRFLSQPCRGFGRTMTSGRQISTTGGKARRASQGKLGTVQCSITFRALGLERAITLANDELKRRGLAATHRVSALHAATDRTAEGAAFSATIFPRFGVPVTLRSRFKLLIAQDGRVLLRGWRRMRRAPVVGASAI